MSRDRRMEPFSSRALSALPKSENSTNAYPCGFPNSFAGMLIRFTVPQGSKCVRKSSAVHQ
jgi:hypothetical protein